MSFQPQFHIPGAFNFDTSGRPGQALHANVFRPPPSPSSSSYNLTKSTGSLFSDISMSNAQPIGMAKRKRASTRESTPMDWNTAMEGANDGREEKSREIRYTLAGQINATPATATVGPDNGLLDESVYSDVDYRRALGPKTPPEPESPSGQMVPDRTEGDTPNQIGWSLFSLRTLGDMVGKVWEFCKNGAFQGFHAGGGSGYNVNGSTVTQTTGNAWTPEVSTPAPPAEDSPMAEVPVYLPPQSHTPYSPVYHDISTPDSTPQPAAKRRQVSANNDELRNWVVVDEPNGQQPKRFASEVRAAAARPSGLVRPRSGYYSQTSASSHRRINAPPPRFTGGTPTLPRAATRPPLRASNAGSPMLPPREPASFASPRSSPSSRSTPSRIPVAVQSPGPVSSNPNPFAIPGTTTVATTAAPLPPFTSALKSSASRPSSRQSARPSSRQSARPSSRQSHTSRHSLGTTTTTTTRPISPTKSSGHRRSGSAITRRQSLLSPPRPVTVDTATAVDATQQQGSSPSRLDAEARQLAQRRIAAERDADMRVDAFNARLLSMIRQGREALGTKVEVEMDVSREGWEDDD